ncbi:hypothetical protein GOPIP_081_00440 [Gordonia polyisoprenivorans NBRC 16320 = JCM 10675]|uniref:VWA domain-containing protein n=1 Tax=Gordonia polyisoprenivorans TaxID=84595 RepID=A0A846WFM7_9ACTN|nr:vWA domain-containing protein [Gordonia polyisoprenivorans]NKY00595.1 VWA domain-containing protein [Gordonia polyisoprenivorans]GAB25405.1 hypothetical protein GOPIP_081_00440 [Gordonia polyisoprenivorans NBRC 16320 = JCM 10675]
MTSRQFWQPVAVVLPSAALPDSVIPTSDGGVIPAHGAGHDHRSFALPDLGPCPAHAVEVVALFDNSPSVSLSGGTDPLANRLAEARQAIGHMAAACRCRRERVSLLSFDQPGRASVLRQPLTRTGVRRLYASLGRMPSEPGSSDLGPGLDVAEHLAGRAPGPVVVVVFSDFLLTDTDPERVLARFSGLEAVRHAVVLGARPPGALSGSDVAVSTITPASEPGAVAQVLAHAFLDARQAGDAVPQ